MDALWVVSCTELMRVILDLLFYVFCVELSVVCFYLFCELDCFEFCDLLCRMSCFRCCGCFV